MGGFFGVLTIVFIVLKLVGTIDWSWWWVLAPVWAPTIVGLAFYALVMIGGWFFTKMSTWRIK